MAFPVSMKGVLLQGGPGAPGVVLLENERNEWELPGGRLEPGEAPEVCLAREVSEELGCAVDVGPLLDCWIYHAPPHDIYHAPPHDDNVVIITYGVTRLETGAFSISDEHKSVRVFPIEDIDHIPLPDGYRRAIRRWALMRNS